MRLEERLEDGLEETSYPDFEEVVRDVQSPYEGLDDVRQALNSVRQLHCPTIPSGTNLWRFHGHVQPVLPWQSLLPAREVVLLLAEFFKEVDVLLDRRKEVP